MDAQQRVFKLKGVVQNYSWGGLEYLPELTGIINKDQQPFAEYWLGAHPNYPATAEDAEGKKLGELLAAHPDILGSRGAPFKALPYLLKVLDVRDMLSIQVHPSRSAAAEGYARENAEGKSLTAGNRNYRDPNHKPELMVALGDFWLLHGFKPEEQLLTALEQRPPLSFLIPVFQKEGYRGLYEMVMKMEQQEVDRILQPLVDSIVPLYQQGVLQKSSEDFWAARAAQIYCREKHNDRGIFSIYFFNLLHLDKDEGIFQPSGLPHAYLEGQNIEIMANSDNVLRGGLTGKHVDVPELLKQVKFEATYPRVLRPPSSVHKIYETAAEEFELHQYQLKPEQQEQFTARTAEVLLVTEGHINLASAALSREAEKGDAFMVPADMEIKISGRDASSVFRATLPADKISHS
jgi:mannose-6-phosphate isomerase